MLAWEKGDSLEVFAGWCAIISPDDHREIYWFIFEIFVMVYVYRRKCSRRTGMKIVS